MTHSIACPFTIRAGNALGAFYRKLDNEYGTCTWTVRVMLEHVRDTVQATNNQCKKRRDDHMAAMSAEELTAFLTQEAEDRRSREAKRTTEERQVAKDGRNLRLEGQKAFRMPGEVAADAATQRAKHAANRAAVNVKNKAKYRAKNLETLTAKEAAKAAADMLLTDEERAQKVTKAAKKQAARDLENKLKKLAYNQKKTAEKRAAEA